MLVNIISIKQNMKMRVPLLQVLRAFDLKKPDSTANRPLKKMESPEMSEGGVKSNYLLLKCISGMRHG